MQFDALPRFEVYRTKKLWQKNCIEEVEKTLNSLFIFLSFFLFSFLVLFPRPFQRRELPPVLLPSSAPPRDGAAHLLLRGLPRPRRAGELRGAVRIGLLFFIGGVGGEQLPRRRGVVPRAVPSRRGGQVSDGELVTSITRAS